MARNYHISQKVGFGRVLIIMLWQSTFPQHDGHHVLQEGTMNINKQFMNINIDL